MAVTSGWGRLVFHVGESGGIRIYDDGILDIALEFGVGCCYYYPLRYRISNVFYRSTSETSNELVITVDTVAVLLGDLDARLLKSHEPARPWHRRKTRDRQDNHIDFPVLGAREYRH